MSLRTPTMIEPQLSSIYFPAEGHSILLTNFHLKVDLTATATLTEVGLF